MLPQQWSNPDYCYLEPVSRVKPEQLHQMAVSTNHNLGGHVIQLTSHLSDVENYRGFQGYRLLSKEKCLKELSNHVLLKNLIDVLYSKNCLHDFMLLFRQLADKSLPVKNIAFLLCLERAKWQSLASTAAMRFRTITKKFWSVVYRLLKGKGIQFFSGTKNWGHIILKMSKRGQMNPKDSKINFAVPNE